MFFPLRDENPTQRVPIVNYGLAALVYLVIGRIVVAVVRRAA